MLVFWLCFQIQGQLVFTFFYSDHSDTQLGFYLKSFFVFLCVWLNVGRGTGGSTAWVAG